VSGYSFSQWHNLVDEDVDLAGHPQLSRPFQVLPALGAKADHDAQPSLVQTLDVQLPEYLWAAKLPDHDGFHAASPVASHLSSHVVSKRIL
jgi:hypothetical protein